MAKRTLVLLIVVLAAALAFALRPVCVPLSPDSLQQFTTPIEQRTDRDFYFKVFQQRDGQWYQCKTWLSRQFYF